MSISVGGIPVAIGKVPLIDDAIGDTIAIGIRSEEGMVHIDSRIDHHDR